MGTGTGSKEVLTRGLLQGLLMATFHGAHLPKPMKRHPGQTYREHTGHARQSCPAGGGATPTGLAGCAPTSRSRIGLQPPSTNSCQGATRQDTHCKTSTPWKSTCHDVHLQKTHAMTHMLKWAKNA